MAPPTLQCWYTEGPAAEGKSVHLVLIQNGGKWGWVNTGWFSTDVQEEQFEGGGLIRDAEIEFQKAGTLSFAKHRIRISTAKLKFQGDFLKKVALTFEANSADAEQFVSLFRETQHVHERLRDQRTLVRNRLKSRVRVPLKDLSEEIFGLVEKQNSTLKTMKFNTTRDAVHEWLVRTVEELIGEGELDGLLDPKTGEYLDKEMAATQQAAVTLDVKVDMKDLLAALAKGGLQVASIKCPQCGGPCSVPESGASVKCGHCATQLQTSDVLNLLRKIIG